jgi:hypothetical protein
MHERGEGMGGISFAPIPGTDGRYVADSEGTLYGFRGALKASRRRERRANGSKGHEHLGVSVCYISGKRTRWVHHLVYEAFHGSVPDGQMVRHLDGDPTNNRLENLAAGTHADNMNDRDAHGTTARGERHGCAKLTVEQVSEIRRIYAAGGITQAALGRKFGISQAMTGYIVRGEYWRESA